MTGGYVCSLGSVNTDQIPYSGSISVTGGTFRDDPSGFLAEGYQVTQNADGLFVVTKD